MPYPKTGDGEGVPYLDSRLDVFFTFILLDLYVSSFRGVFDGECKAAIKLLVLFVDDII